MFENSLIELDAKRNSRGLRCWIMPVALGLHLVVGGALLFAQYWNVPGGPGAAHQRRVHERGGSSSAAAASAAAAAAAKPQPKVEMPKEIPRSSDRAGAAGRDPGEDPRAVRRA